MKILVDADACPVRSIVEKVARKYKIKTIMITDVNHVINSDYSTVVTVSQGKDSADMKLANMTQRGDVVVSQDYGVASMVLGKGAFAISNSGTIYDDENIERLMFERFLSAKVRASGKKGGKLQNAKKRLKSDDARFEANFEKLCVKAINCQRDACAPMQPQDM